MDANTAPSAVRKELSTGGFQVLVVDLHFHLPLSLHFHRYRESRRGDSTDSGSDLNIGLGHAGQALSVQAYLQVK